MSKTALVTGASGQDSSFLIELLLTNGYSVVGTRRRTSTQNLSRIAHLLDHPNLRLEFCDITEAASVRRVLNSCEPDEIYNLAAQSFVAVSFLEPDYTRKTIFQGTRNLIGECLHLKKKPRIYLAGSSEMYGNSPAPQNEKTLFAPVSPYAKAKADAFHWASSYRKIHGMWITNGILFNHESHRRGEEFVTRKITRALGRMACGLQETCSLGNLDSKRDWGFAGDYVEAMHAMLQHEQPDDFVIATGETRTVGEFLDVACSEMAKQVPGDYRSRFITDPKLFRPAEVHCLLGDASKAREALGWRPRTTFPQLVESMVRADYQLAWKEAVHQAVEGECK